MHNEISFECLTGTSNSIYSQDQYQLLIFKLFPIQSSLILVSSSSSWLLGPTVKVKKMQDLSLILPCPSIPSSPFSLASPLQVLSLIPPNPPKFSIPGLSPSHIFSCWNDCNGLQTGYICPNNVNQSSFLLHLKLFNAFP